MTLERSHDKIIGGVCGGIARRYGWDPTLVRILYVLISLFSAAFPGIVVYVVLWFLMPLEGTSAAARRTPPAAPPPAGGPPVA